MRSLPDKKLSKAAIKAWRISTTLIVLFLILVPLTFWLSSYIWQVQSYWSLAAILAVAIVAGGLFSFFIPEIRWQHWYYQVDEHEIDLQSGIVIVTRTLVPAKRVQHVDTRQGPILRSYGLADVTISTAATTHRIPALDEETANNVRDQISKFARLAKEDV